MKVRAINILIAIDQLIFVLITFGRGNPDMTISGASWSLEQRGKIGGIIFRPIIDFIFLPFEKEHCKKAWEYEKDKRTSRL